MDRVDLYRLPLTQRVSDTLSVPVLMNSRNIPQREEFGVGSEIKKSYFSPDPSDQGVHVVPFQPVSSTCLDLKKKD